MKISCVASAYTYPIVIESGALGTAHDLFALDRRVCIVTDTGVPSEYAATIAAQCAAPLTVTIPQGENSKSLSTLEHICQMMLENGFTRDDCIVAVGGGVVGDMAGFTASCYMRGIDFYNVPTTVLSQVDSSIGGKTAVNFSGVKNIIGAFYPPKAVLIDPNVLQTLPQRQISNGLAEAVKMSATSDEKLFTLFETGDIRSDFEAILTGSINIKRKIVQEDEKEHGTRKILNFGHTIGHGIEVSNRQLLHGECVALGMLSMCSDAVKQRLQAVLQKIGLPTSACYNKETAWNAILHDKKMTGDRIDIVWVDAIGCGEIRRVDTQFVKDLMR